MPRNLKDMRFGLLNAVERTERREDGYYVWRCECKCGGEVFVNTKRLLRGTVTDCGCIPKSNAKRGSIAENLIGRRFGEWEVLYRAKNRSGRVMWVCRCSCGTIRNISARDLKMGKTRSCRNSIHNNLRMRRNLTGKTFGGLEVLHPTNQRDYKGSVIWYCRCIKCGREKVFSEATLVHGRYKSCGCNQYVFGKELAKQLHHYKGTTIEAIGLNRKARSDNQLGVAGVSKSKKGTYRATIGFQGKRYYLGTYTSIDEAGEVYKNAKRALHGTFIKAYTAWMEGEKRDELIFDVNYLNGEFLVKSNYLSKERDATETEGDKEAYKSMKYMIQGHPKGN